MRNVIRAKKVRVVRPAWWAASAVAAVAVGLVAGPAYAAPPNHADKASHAPGEAGLNEPLLRHGALTVRGTEASDEITLRLQAGEPGILEVDFGDDGSADFSFERAKIASIEVKARAGDDHVRIDESNGVFTDSIPTTLAGEAGNDDLAGGSGAETMLGGPGNDSLDGNRGNDLAVMGAGDDTFVWDPGDGSDTIEGQAGADTMLFNGANVPENVYLTANGNRLTFFRDAGTITMDTNGVERVDFNALGGADTVTVNDLTATHVDDVNVDLAGTLGGATGDGQPDRITVHATDRRDAIDVAGDISGVTVSGLSALVAIQHQEPTDALAVNGLGRDDVISAAALAAQAITLSLDGGTGDDAIAGGQGIETMLGGDGNDSLDGNRGNDLALMGAGDDTFVWDPGDGSDTIEGQDGADTMLFNGANVPENVSLTANGNRLTFFRDAGTITMDTNGVERVDFNALGGADTVTVNDLSATDVEDVNIDLAGTLGGAAGDGSPDRVIVNATDGDDTIDVDGDARGVNVAGLAAMIRVLHAEAANDVLEINTLAGTDTVDSDGLDAGVIQLFVDGALVQ